jgi:hypothetical protein
MIWKCKHVYRHTWEEEVANAATFHVSFSCTYYWKNPRLMKDFVSQYGKTRHYWSFTVEGQYERKRMEGDRSNSLSGHSYPASDIITSYDNAFRSNTESSNFPYEFNPNTVCMGCKFYLK